jgi:eukaryotic-like serine/threonine-protein kinase
VIRTAKPGSGAWARGLLAQLFTAQAGVEGAGANPLAVLDRLLHVDPAPDAVASVALSLSMVLFVTICLGRSDLSWACVARIEAITAALADDPSETVKSVLEESVPFVHVARGMYAWNTGAYSEAVVELRMGTKIPERIGPSLGFVMLYLGEALVDGGAHAEAVEVGQRLVAMGQAAGNPMDAGLGHWVLSHALRGAGDFEAAEREARLAVEMLRGVQLDYPPVLATLAAALLAQGRAAEALVLAREAREEQAKHERLAYRRVFVLLVVAECLAATGDVGAAREVIAAARAWIHGVASTMEDPSHRRRFLEDVVENRRALDLARAWLEPS